MNSRLAYSHAILVTKLFYPPTLVFFVLIQNCVCMIELMMWTKVSKPVIKSSCFFEVYCLSIMR